MKNDLSGCPGETREIPPQILLRTMDGPGPRCTSYPTADRFADDFDAASLSHALTRRRHIDEAGAATPLSVYVHVPFCESVCYYCACNKVVTKNHKRAAPYLDALGLELDLITDAIGWQRSVSQLHLGGGSPTFLSDDGLVELEQGAIQVTSSGWYVVRAVALVFDRHLKDSAPRERFSRIV